MATRRYIFELVRRASASVPSHQTPYLTSRKPSTSLFTNMPLKAVASILPRDPNSNWHSLCSTCHIRRFASVSSGESEKDELRDGEKDASAWHQRREYSLDETHAEAAEIGYQVLGPLQKYDNVLKPYEPVFAVVQVGSHQFKVCNGDSIFTERLKFCEVNDKLILNKVLLLASDTQTIVGRPILPDATVHAVVEEHALDAKVLIFKKKRRKNYRRTKGHRQELTKLRITDIQGIEKPERKPKERPLRIACAETERTEVVA